MLQEEIKSLRKEIANYEVSTSEGLAIFKAQFMSGKGRVAQLFTILKSLPVEEKASIGKLLNGLKVQAEQRYKDLQATLPTRACVAVDVSEDITLPPVPQKLGTVHPITQITERIIEIFARIGFSLAEGPEVENDWYNFTALNFPKHHPARDMQDTFFLAEPTKSKGLLRTHTSSVQIRTMQNMLPPIRVLSTGKVFRKEAISARTHCFFHQLEAFYVDTDVNFLGLKATVFFLYMSFLVLILRYVFGLLIFLLPNLVQK